MSEPAPSLRALSAVLAHGPDVAALVRARAALRRARVRALAARLAMRHSGPPAADAARRSELWRSALGWLTGDARP